MRVCLGGTFHPFHVGHEALLRAAARGADALFVGITDGALARRDRPVPDWRERAVAVAAFLKATGFRGELRIRALRDPVGPAATEPFDIVVASPETAGGADRINEARRAAGLPPLAVRLVPHVAGQDLLPVSATAVAAGRIDRAGRRLVPARVVVGSRNPVKVAAVEAEVGRLLSCPVEVVGVEVASGVPEQPRGPQTLEGARNRAAAALASEPGTGADYAVGVEAGLNRDDEGGWFDVQACVVLDRNGRETRGWGPAFQYPDWVTERALAGEMVSDILGPVANDPRIGGTTGAVGFLTAGAMDRTALTRVAVLMAFVPRIRSGVSVPPVAA